MLSPHDEQALFNWAFSFKKRFPTWLDSRFTKGLYALIGAAHGSFLSASSSFHFKRLLLTQFFLQKKIETELSQDNADCLSVKIAPANSRLCISLATSSAQNTLTSDTILEVASQRVPALIQVPHSFYQWTCPPYSFLYIELDKMRGNDLSPVEVKEVEAYLNNHLSTYIKKPSIFWPYNHEDAFKHILILGKEVTKEDDYPQVMIHFQKQTGDFLEFLIVLARPEKVITKETELSTSRFPPSTRLIFRLKHPLLTTFSVLGEAFSLQLPSERFKVGTMTNLLHAREFVAKLLQDVIGTFRDYNGGLLEVQKKHYKPLEEKFSQKIPKFSLFGRELFYSLTPAEAPLCLSIPLWRELFKAFSESLSKKSPFLTKKTPHTLILKTKDPERLTPYLEKAKELQEMGKITAYANLKVSSEHYLVFIDEVGNDIAAIKVNHEQAKKKRILRLAFQDGKLHSLSPLLLSQEIRGCTIAKLLFQGLIRLDLNHKVEYMGCEKVTISKNRTRYLFKIRPHLWSNGENVTAFHYEQSWQQSFLKETAINAFYNIKNAHSIKKANEKSSLLGVKALTSDVLQVDLEKADPFFLEKLAHPMFFPSLNGLSEPQYFNGAYSIKHKREDYLLLEKNYYYWNKKCVYFDQIEIKFENSKDQICKKFKNKETDWIGAPFNCGLHIPFSKLKEKKIFRPFFIYLNTQHPLLQSPLIRQALSSVIDRQFVSKFIFKGCQPLFNFLPTTTSHNNPNIYHQNNAKGRFLFEKGLKSLKIEKGESHSITLNYYSHLSENKHLAEYLKKTWFDTFQIKINLKNMPWNELHYTFEKGIFHIGGLFKHLFSNDPFPFLHSFLIKDYNYSQWSHPSYVNFFDQAEKSRSNKEKLNYLNKLEDLLLLHMPAIPLVTKPYLYNHSAQLTHYVIDQEGEVDFSLASFQGKPTSNQGFPCYQNTHPLNPNDMNNVEKH